VLILVQGIGIHTEILAQVLAQQPGMRDIGHALLW
jgi:hypothetical protein